MRVLQLISSGGCYGAEKMLTGLSSALMKLGCISTVAVFKNSLTPHMEVAEEAQRCGLKVEVIPCEGRADHRTVKHIRQCLKGQQIDVLHTHGYKADLYGFLAKWKAGQPIIATCHNWTSESLSVRAYETLDRLVLRSFDKIVAVSAGVAKSLQRMGVAERKITIIGNGIDLCAFSDARPTYGQEIGKGSRVVVGMVGRLVPEKGPQYLLTAGQEILKSFPDTLFVFVGDGPARKQLQELACALGMAESVVFAGQRSDMPEVYASIDIFVLPSLREAMPLSVMEAMAAGKPVVATRVGAIPRLVSDGLTGLLIDPGNRDALRDAIVRLLADAKLRWDFGMKGQLWAVDRFSSETMARRYLAVYEEIVRRQRAA